MSPGGAVSCVGIPTQVCVCVGMVCVLMVCTCVCIVVAQKAFFARYTASVEQYCHVVVSFRQPHTLFSTPRSQGFGILLYGFGSKRHLLDSFLRSRPEDHAVLSVDGRAPGLTAHQVLVRVAHTMGRASMQQLRYVWVCMLGCSRK